MSDHLRIPQGTESFYLEDAFTHQRLLRTFEDTCHRWAYLPVTTPVYDYHDAYRGILSEDHESKSFRLIDRTGELLILRPDVTLFLARQMGLVLQPDDLPVRVHYGDTIVRHEDPDHPSKDEYFQVGAELIGKSGLEAEAEMILLLFDALDQWNAKDVVVHIGHRGILTEHDRDGVAATAISHRDWAAVRAVFTERGVDAERADSLVSLLGFIGTGAELEARVAQAHGLTTGERDALNHLLSLAEEAQALGYGERVRIDLSEVGSQTYHSGVVFQAYAEGVSAPVASGGRYDGLLGRFGFTAPSVGFSVMLRRIQSVVQQTHGDDGRSVLPAEGASFRERARFAAKARAQGKVVQL